LSAQKFSYVRRAGPNNNILEPYFDLKHQIERLYYVKFTTKEIIDTNISFQAILKYLEEANKGTMNLAIDVNAVYRIPVSDELISYFIANGRITPGEIRHNELVYLYIDNVGSQRYNVHMDKTYSAEVVFGRKLIGVDDIGNRYYDDNIIDLSHTQYYTVDNLNYIPVDDNEKPFIKIGNGVIAEFGLYQKIISYDMEVNVNKVSADNQARFGRLYSAYVTAANNWYGTAARYYVDGAGYREFKNDDPNATGTITQAQKNVLENNYKQARAAYMAILQEELDKRESEAVIV
jgi:hypothetical protein